MFMYPEPPPNQYRLRNVTLASLTSELFMPDSFPRCTQTNLGLYAYPLGNSSAEIKVRKVHDIVLNRWAQNAKAWWVDKPSDVSHILFDLHQKTKDNKETDPRYKYKISLFPRSYQYEMDCVEEQRQQKLIRKMLREEQAVLPLEKSRDKETENVSARPLRWQKPPDVFGKSQEDPCKRRMQFQKFGQSYKTEACRFYYDNYPPPPLSKHLKKVGK